MTGFYIRWRKTAPGVGLALSVVVGQALVWFLPFAIEALVLLLLGASLLCRFGKKMGAVIPGVALGMISALLMLPQVTPLPRVEDAMIRGVVQGTPRHPVPGEVVFSFSTVINGQMTELRCRAVELPWRHAANLEDGDEVWLRGELTPTVASWNPFSWESGLYRRGISGEVRARFVSAAISKNPGLATRVRAHIQRVVSDSVGESGASGLFLSMALGYQDLISTQLEKACKRLGLTHILVVSGYQVSLVFGCALALFGCVPLSVLRVGRLSKRTLHVCALSFAGLYAFAIGAEMSVTRAFVAAACLTAQMISERASSFAQRWGLALFVMVLVWPWSFFEVGVILTFAALFGIGLGASQARRPNAFFSFLWVNVAVWLCTSLVMLVWRGRISPLGLLVNVLVATPWSVINCAVGLTSLIGVMLKVPGAQACMWLVLWCNDRISDLVLVLGEWRFSGFELVGSPRVLVGLCLVSAILRLVWVSIRRCHGVAA